MDPKNQPNPQVDETNTLLEHILETNDTNDKHTHTMLENLLEQGAKEDHVPELLENNLEMQDQILTELKKTSEIIPETNFRFELEGVEHTEIQGPRGLTGKQGPKGDKGDKGDRGEKGDKGEDGPVGPRGLVGPEGKQGVKGNSGPTGVMGPKGETGPKGADGKNGKDGKDFTTKPEEIAKLITPYIEYSKIKGTPDVFGGKKGWAGTGYLREISDVAITTPIDGQTLSFNATTQKWENKTSTATGGVTSVNSKTGVVVLTTSDIADSTDSRYITDAQKIVLGNTSGSNTGDETTATIKTKLGITTLSGSNTGDQDLSTYVVGPTSATAESVAFFDGTTGKLLKNGSTTATPRFGAIGVGKGASASIRHEIKTDATFTQGVRVEGDIVGRLGFSGFITGDTYVRYTQGLDGKMEWGDGTVVADTNLYRSAANVLKTDDAFVASNITAGATVSGSNTGDQDLSTYPTLTSTSTLTNKRVTKRTGTVASSATPTINTDNVDFYSITALAADITSFTTNLSGTPTEGQTLWIAITGTAARAITWGTSFESSTATLPTTTVTTARLDVGFVWNTVTSKWRCVATS